MLTDSTSVGRLPGLKAAAPGLHVLLHGNLFGQWCAYTEQAVDGSAAGLEATLQIGHASHHDPVLRRLSEMFPVQAASERSADLFYRFVFTQLYLHAHAAGAADLVIDTDRLSTDRPYRRDTEAAFAGQAVPVDLSDLEGPRGFSLLELPSRAAYREQVNVVGRFVIDSAPKEAGRRSATELLHGFLAEFERHERHVERLRPRLLRAMAQNEELGAERERAAAARQAADQLRTQCDTMKAEQDRLHAAHAALTLERNAIAQVSDTNRAETTAARRARDAAMAETAHLGAAQALLQAEAAALRQAHAETQAALGRAAASHAAIAAERDALRQARDDASAGLRRAVADGQRAEADRDRARAERDRLHGEQAMLREWAAKDRAAVLSSRSWRLTRPLRRLGIDRPNRPPRPGLLEPAPSTAEQRANGGSPHDLG